MRLTNCGDFAMRAAETFRLYEHGVFPSEETRLALSFRLSASSTNRSWYVPTYQPTGDVSFAFIRSLKPNTIAQVRASSHVARSRLLGNTGNSGSFVDKPHKCAKKKTGKAGYATERETEDGYPA
jgi:hypothetical protein